MGKEKKAKKEKKEKKRPAAATTFSFGAPLEGVDDKVSSLFSAGAAVPQPKVSFGQFLPERDDLDNSSSDEDDGEDGEDGDKAAANPLAWMGGTFGMNAGQETAAKEASESKTKAVAAANAAAAATARYEARELAKKEKAKMAAKKRPIQEEEDLPTQLSKRQKKIADRATRSTTAQLYPVSVSNISHKCKRKHLQTIFSAKVEVASIRLVARPVGEAAAAAAKSGATTAKDEPIGAYVMFFSQRAADIAVKECNGAELQGKKIKVAGADGSTFGFCNSKGSNKEEDVAVDSTLIMVTNLPMSVDEKEALKLFKGCGAVVGHKLEKKEKKQKVFFYLLFAAVKSVDKALKVDGNDYKGEKVVVVRSTNWREARRIAASAAAPPSEAEVAAHAARKARAKAADVARGKHEEREKEQEEESDESRRKKSTLSLPPVSAADKEKYPDMRPGDWICPSKECGNLNFAVRMGCRRCPEVKPGVDPSTVKRESRAQQRPGDWICPAKGCSNLNFASRMVCRRCPTGKPTPADA